MADFFPALPQPYSVTHPEQASWPTALVRGIEAGQQIYNNSIKNESAQDVLEREQAKNLALAEYARTGDTSTIMPFMVSAEQALGAPAKAEKLQAEAAHEVTKYAEAVLPYTSFDNYQAQRSDAVSRFPQLAPMLPESFASPEEFEKWKYGKIQAISRAKFEALRPILGTDYSWTPQTGIQPLAPGPLVRSRIGLNQARADKARMVGPGGAGGGLRPGTISPIERMATDIQREQAANGTPISREEAIKRARAKAPDPLTEDRRLLIREQAAKLQAEGRTREEVMRILAEKHPGWVDYIRSYTGLGPPVQAPVQAPARPAPAGQQSATPPLHLFNGLEPGKGRQFNDGSVWTLENGVPKRVR